MELQAVAPSVGIRVGYSGRLGPDIRWGMGWVLWAVGRVGCVVRSVGVWQPVTEAGRWFGVLVLFAYVRHSPWNIIIFEAV